MKTPSHNYNFQTPAPHPEQPDNLSINDQLDFDPDFDMPDYVPQSWMEAHSNNKPEQATEEPAPRRGVNPDFIAFLNEHVSANQLREAANAAAIAAAAGDKETQVEHGESYWSGLDKLKAAVFAGGVIISAGQMVHEATESYHMPQHIAETSISISAHSEEASKALAAEAANIAVTVEADHGPEHPMRLPKADLLELTRLDEETPAPIQRNDPTYS
jgi:hypothetical protein